MPRGSIRANTAQLDLVREGEISVQIIRPFDPPLPPNLRWGWYSAFEPLPPNLRWGWYSAFEGRKQFSLARRPVEMIRVHYTVHTDDAMLRNLEHRSSQNRSGVAVRGLARSEHGRPATVDLSDRIIAALVKRAANNDSKRMTEGPVRVAVKLLEPQTGTPPTCDGCHKTLAEHERVEVTKHGDRDPETNLWDADRPYQEPHWLCPLEVPE